jgi:hypothetical protein
MSAQTNPNFSVRRANLFKVLGFKGDRIPLEGATFQNVNVPLGRDGKNVYVTKVVVRTFARGDYFHRVCVECKECGRLIPFGRFQNHKAVCK